jgi:hypothetical protein
MHDRRGTRVRRVASQLLLGAVVALGTTKAALAVPPPDPTAQELHFLYEVNRARHDPPAWAAEYGLGSQTGGDGLPTTLIGVEPRPPLALNATLVDSAGFKAEEMATNDYFGHHSEVGPNFYWPNDLVRHVFGYPLPMQMPEMCMPSCYMLPDASNQIESIAAGFGPGSFDNSQAVNAVIGLIVDDGVPDLGHRIHLLGMDDFSALFVEAGPGYGYSALAYYRNYWAFHTGMKASPETFLTGIVFADGNGNSLFDPGEGLAGVTVEAGLLSAITGASGGYSISIPSGTHAVTCSGGAFSGTASASVDVIGFNREVDCISGEASAVVDFVPEPGAAALGLAAVAALVATRRLRGSG